MEYLLYLCCVVGGWILLYYLIKAAVKNAIIEAREQKPLIHLPHAISPKEPEWNSQQINLKKQYESAEITLDEYRKQFNQPE